MARQRWSGVCSSVTGAELLPLVPHKALCAPSRPSRSRKASRTVVMSGAVPPPPRHAAARAAAATASRPQAFSDMLAAHARKREGAERRSRHSAIQLPPTLDATSQQVQVQASPARAARSQHAASCSRVRAPPHARSLVSAMWALLAAVVALAARATGDVEVTLRTGVVRSSGESRCCARWGAGQSQRRPSTAARSCSCYRELGALGAARDAGHAARAGLTLCFDLCARDLTRPAVQAHAGAASGPPHGTRALGRT